MAKTNKPGLLLNGRAQLEFLVRVLNPALFVMLLGGHSSSFRPLCVGGRWRGRICRLGCLELLPAKS